MLLAWAVCLWPVGTFHFNQREHNTEQVSRKNGGVGPTHRALTACKEAGTLCWPCWLDSWAVEGLLCCAEEGRIHTGAICLYSLSPPRQASQVMPPSQMAGKPSERRTLPVPSLWFGLVWPGPQERTLLLALRLGKAS